MAGTEPVTPAQPRPVIVTLPAEIDVANADAVGERIGAAFAPGVKVVIADMTGTTFTDSIGIRMLVLAWQRATATGNELRLLLPGPAVLRIMTILGLDTVLPIYRSLEAALAVGDDHGIPVKQAAWLRRVAAPLLGGSVHRLTVWSRIRGMLMSQTRS
jgi:anti-anti-sigma factor